MAMNTQEISEAFSGHRFTETYEHLADGVRWELEGAGVIEGKDAVVSACESPVEGILTGCASPMYCTYLAPRVCDWKVNAPAS